MNILFTRFPFESVNGGAENQTQWLMEGLRAHGHEVGFLGSCSVLLERCSTLNTQNSKLNIGPPPVTTWLALSFLWRRAAMQKALIHAIQSLLEQPDVIFMLSLSEKLLLTAWAVQQGINVFWIEHDRIGRWLTWNPWLFSLKKLSRLATIICVSELSKNLYRRMGFDAGRIVSIPNGVPFFPHPPTPSPFGGRGALQEEKDGWTVKKPVRPAILQFARTMRKAPTPAEELLWQRLRFDQLGVRFRRQHPVKSRILDFYCHTVRLGIEVDGPIHEQPEREQYDRDRTEGLAELGIRIIRFTNNEVLQNVNTVIVRIKDYLHAPPLSGRGLKDCPCSPPPSGEGLGVGVGVVARLSPEKGIDVLIHSIADLPEISLTIVGTGKEEGYLRTLIAEDTRRIGAERIHLVQYVDDLEAFYASLDIFVLPSSDHDPFGLVAAEAMMCSIPTIVTDACGLAGSLEDGIDALIVPAGSVSALADAIKRLEEPEYRQGIALRGQQAAVEHFSLQHMVDEYEKILRGQTWMPGLMY